jgi:hypothetical protein
MDYHLKLGGGRDYVSLCHYLTPLTFELGERTGWTHIYAYVNSQVSYPLERKCPFFFNKCN